jgi:hypothetical protein
MPIFIKKKQTNPSFLETMTCDGFFLYILNFEENKNPSHKNFPNMRSLKLRKVFDILNLKLTETEFTI